MTIELVTMFKCPETGKLFKTERGAENSAKRTRDSKELSLLATGFDPSGFEAQRDYVRLNATTPLDVMNLVEEKAEEFWGLKITAMSVGRVSVSYGGDSMSFGQCHIEVSSKGSCRLAYMREQARINKDKWYRDPSISDLLFGSMGFRGLETGGGCPGICGDYPLRMSLTARLEEFPLIAKRHRDWVAHKSEYDRYKAGLGRTERYGAALARSTAELERLVELRAYHRKCEEAVKKSIHELESYYVGGLVQKWEMVNPPVEKNTELWEMFGG